MTTDPDPIEINVHQVKSRIGASDGFLLLDCRERAEVETVAIDGSFWLPMSELVDRVAELESHREHNIVVYCHLGGRSLQVATYLRERGFAAQSMTGGINQWSAEIDPKPCSSEA